MSIIYRFFKRRIKPYLSRALLSILIFLISSSCSDQPEPFVDEGFELKEVDNIITANSRYIAVIGDIQSYTLSSNSLHYLIETCDWLRSQQIYFNNFSCVLQNGDLTENNIDIQWYFADTALSHLGQELLLIPSTGNHDYSWGQNGEISDRQSSLFKSMKCLASLREQEIQQFECEKFDNIVVPLKFGVDSISIIALEFGPRKEVVMWADSIVRANLDKKYILMTHEWLSAKGLRVDKNSYAAWQMSNLSHSTPQEIWEKMVYPNDNILCVLCGHNGFCKYLYSTNQAGREVCQILFNLQYQENGGDGMVQLWEFPKDENVINISVYNTIKREYHPDPETRISIQL